MMSLTNRHQWWGRSEVVIIDTDWMLNDVQEKIIHDSSLADNHLCSCSWSPPEQHWPASGRQATKTRRKLSTWYTYDTHTISIWYFKISIFLSVYPSIYLSNYLSAYLSICLSVYLSSYVYIYIVCLRVFLRRFMRVVRVSKELCTFHKSCLHFIEVVHVS